MRVIAGQITLTEDDLLRGAAEMPERQNEHRPLVVGAVMGILGLSLWVVSKDMKSELLSTWVVPSAIVPFVTVFLLPYFRRRSVQRHLSGMNEEQRLTRYQFRSKNFTLSDGRSTVKSRYDELVGFVEGETSFLLYTQPRLAKIVPKRAFASSDIDNLRQRFLDKIPVYRMGRGFSLSQLIAAYILLILVFFVVWGTLSP